MYRLDPKAVYVHDRVKEDSRAVQRMERMLSAMGVSRESVTTIRDDDIPDLIRDKQWESVRVRQGKLDGYLPRVMVFTAMHTDGDGKAAADAMMKRCPQGTPRTFVERLLGYHWLTLGHPKECDVKNNEVCWSAYEFNTLDGCPHGCRYCGGGQVINAAVNLEEIIAKLVDPVLQKNPWQKAFRNNTQSSDTICFEPEYELTELLARRFAEYGDRYVIVHTKSANVDHLLDLDVRKSIICVWSTTCDTVSRQLEPGTATASERIEAARKCQEAGMAVRFKYKPIIPIKNWREEYAANIKEMFEKTRPEIVTLCVVRWMGYEEFRQVFDTSGLDPAFVAAAEAASGQLKGPEPPFPREVREEIYRFFIREIRRWDPKVPISISTETREMWDALADLLGCDGRNYLCGCGPQCVPGPRFDRSGGARTGNYERPAAS